EARHDEVENNRIDALALVAVENGERAVAALGNERVVAEFSHHIVEKPALHRIVVDDQNTLTHDTTSRPRVPCTELGHCGPVGLMAAKFGRSPSGRPPDETCPETIPVSRRGYGAWARGAGASLSVAAGAYRFRLPAGRRKRHLRSPD